MTRDIININNFTILVETAEVETTSIDVCGFEEPIIGVAFYGSGNVELEVEFGTQKESYQHTKGLALSFYADDQVSFKHTVQKDKPLECLVIVTAVTNLQKLPNQEGELFTETLDQLVNPSDHYVQGPQFLMPPIMFSILEQFFTNTYTGKTKMMFFRSQITALLSHFFGVLSEQKTDNIKASEREKLFQAKEILISDLENPPSLDELARQIGLNSFKLKKNFKELFGVPVFKYLQNERLSKAHELLRVGEISIQEAAWEVGYDSLSSFSNAFSKKFGFRPSQIKS